MTEPRLGERLIAEARLAKWETMIDRAMVRALAAHRRAVEADVRRALSLTAAANRRRTITIGPGDDLNAAAPPVDPFDEAVWADTLGRELTPVLHQVFAEITDTTMAGFYDDPLAHPPVDLTHQLDRMLGHMQGLGPEMSARLGATLTEGFNAGEGWSDLDRRVRDTFGVGERRASTISRTETVGAANGASHDVARTLVESGLALEKEWLATGDDRTRKTHVRASGQRVAFDAKFMVGDCELERPHDPLALGCPQEIVNCRCVLLYPEASEAAVIEVETFEASAMVVSAPTGARGGRLPANDPIVIAQRQALDAIAKVHRVPDLAAGTRHPGQPRQWKAQPISVQKRKDLGGGAAAHFDPNGEIDGQPAIRLKAGTRTPAFDFAHEFGHYFDFGDLDAPGKYSTEFERGSTDPRLVAFGRAVQESQAFNKLRQRQATAPARDQPYFEYLLSGRELWARAYSQWITKRSKNVALAQGLDVRLRNMSVPYQWTDDDFEPIGRALDELFAALGLASS